MLVEQLDAEKVVNLEQEAGDFLIENGLGTPDFIVEAAIKALRDGHHGYTPAVGIMPLREAVAADLGKRFNVKVSPDEVMIMPGGKPTMFMSVLMFGEPGADILYPDPGFPIYRSIIEYTGARPIPVPIRGLVGSNAVAQTLIAPTGNAYAAGEAWSARSQGEPISPGTPLRVLQVKGLELLVEPAGAAGLPAIQGDTNVR